MREMLLLDVPHRQVVFTIPKRLRVFFKFKRRLLGELCRLALRALSRYFELVAGSGHCVYIEQPDRFFGNLTRFARAKSPDFDAVGPAA